MAHEIGLQDGLVLHARKAWHGLGTVVDDAPTPRDALGLAGLDWMVEQWPLSAETDDTRLMIDSHVVNVRSDTLAQLGIVGKDYRPIQNHDMAEFCEALTDAGTVRVETAGSIRNGAKVWFLLKGEAFNVANGDEVFPYVLVSNGHDGGTALRVTPTTIRVVCSNTLHMVIPRTEGRGIQRQSSCFIAFHNGDIRRKVDQAREALVMYGTALENTQRLADRMARTPATEESIEYFFTQCYSWDFGSLGTAPSDRRRRERAVAAFNVVMARFEQDRDTAGASVWNIYNAYTGWLQNDTFARIKNRRMAAERRAHSNLFGLNAQRTAAAFDLAYGLCV